MPAVSPVDHTETGHAQRGAIFVNGDSVRYGVQIDIPVRDMRIDRPEFPQRDNGTDVASGV